MIAAAVPKPLPVSGWDLAGNAHEAQMEGRTGAVRGRPRPTRFAVPAGAVYFWKRGRKSVADPVPAPLASLCDKPADAAAGWGLTLSGTWHYCSLEKGTSPISSVMPPK